MLSRNGILKAMDAGDITIDPFDSRHLGPNSYDLTLGDKIAFYVLTGEGVDYPTTTYGQVAPDLTPDMFGHMAALEPDSPVTKHIVQRPLMNLAGRPPILQREISKDGIVLYPGNVYLAQVNEKICGKRYVPELTGRSSLARAGVGVEVSAPYANLGDELCFTVEITVKYPTLIFANMRIAQVFFHQVEPEFETSSTYIYSGKYSEKRFHEKGQIVSYIPDPELEAYMYQRIQEQIREREMAEKMEAMKEQNAGQEESAPVETPVPPVEQPEVPVVEESPVEEEVQVDDVLVDGITVEEDTGVSWISRRSPDNILSEGEVNEGHDNIIEDVLMNDITVSEDETPSEE